MRFRYPKEKPPVEGKRAIGIPMRNANGKSKLIWVPRKLLNGPYKKSRIIDVPDWFMDRKIRELKYSE